MRYHFQEQFDPRHVRQKKFGDDTIDLPRPVQFKTRCAILRLQHDTIWYGHFESIRIVSSILVFLVDEKNGRGRGSG